jgi:hypothetical protein
MLRRLMFAAGLAPALFATSYAAGSPEPPLPPYMCKHLKPNPDGSWTAAEPFTIFTPTSQTRVRGGDTLRYGVPFANRKVDDLIRKLETECQKPGFRP